MHALADENIAECAGVFRISIKIQIPLAAKEAIVHVDDVARDLHPPRVVRMRRDAGNMYGSRCDIDKEQDVVRNETPDRADFDD
jgi:hypothetical protein